MLIGGAASEAARVVADADLVVVGDIRTMDEERSQADGMAIKDGRIIYVGKASEARDRLRRGGRLIEARRGQVVLPGFIDSHVHMLEAGVLSLRCLLGELYLQAGLNDAAFKLADALVTAQPGLAKAYLLRGKARARERWIFGLPLALVALAGLGLLGRPLWRRRSFSL